MNISKNLNSNFFCKSLKSKKVKEAAASDSLLTGLSQAQDKIKLRKEETTRHQDRN